MITKTTISGSPNVYFTGHKKNPVDTIFLVATRHTCAKSLLSVTWVAGDPKGRKYYHHLQNNSSTTEYCPHTLKAKLHCISGSFCGHNTLVTLAALFLDTLVHSAVSGDQMMATRLHFRTVYFLPRSQHHTTGHLRRRMAMQGRADPIGEAERCTPRCLLSGSRAEDMQIKCELFAISCSSSC